MATDQAAPASDVDIDVPKTVTAEMSETAKTPAARSTQTKSSGGRKKPRSVLEKVRPPRRSFGEYVRSSEGRAAIMTYFVSTVLHALVLLALALVVLDQDTLDNLFQIVSKPPEQEIQDEEVFQALEQPDQIYNDSFEDNPQDTIATDIIAETTPLQLDINDFEPSVEILDSDLQSLTEIAKEGEFGGRSAKGKKGLVKSQGGNAASEAAVVRGLKWLADIQLPDGSWSFSELGESSNPGQLNDCKMGATGMALMAFLGAGHTHKKEGPYKDAVMGGLSYLMNNARLVPAGADFRAKSNQGNMYVQGICVIALAEAYGMSKDKPLRRAAEGGIAFIINAQDSAGGGWRYKPQQAGDTSVVGWQVMALISGHGSKIHVPRNVMNGANAFLDYVQAEDEKHIYYGYDKPAKRLSTTAIGLLCRMYLGWDHDNGKLKKGVAYLASQGPSKNDDYYNYYATQVMHHWGGDVWTKWNDVMRDQLIDTQDMEGVEAGSWKPRGAGHAVVQGGRLYTTVLNIMSLEVYYRHLPLYQRNAVQADF